MVGRQKAGTMSEFVEESFVCRASSRPFLAERMQMKARSVLLEDSLMLEYWTDGDQASGPAVMLVHGRWGRVSIWIGSPRYGLFLRMPTRPNYGGSSEHGSYDYASFADDVSQLVDFLGVQRLHVIGGSSGDL